MVLSALKERKTRYDAYIALTFSQYIHLMLLTCGNDTLQGVDRC